MQSRSPATTLGLTAGELPPTGELAPAGELATAGELAPPGSWPLPSRSRRSRRR